MALLIKFGAPVFIVSKLLAMIPGLSGVALVPGAIVDLSVALGLGPVRMFCVSSRALSLPSV